jgi:hypothetical protein
VQHSSPLAEANSHMEWEASEYRWDAHSMKHQKSACSTPAAEATSARRSARAAAVAAAAATAASTAKATKVKRNTGELVCQVPGCGESLVGAKEYHQRYRVCPQHAKVSRSNSGASCESLSSPQTWPVSYGKLLHLAVRQSRSMLVLHAAGRTAAELGCVAKEAPRFACPANQRAFTQQIAAAFQVDSLELHGVASRFCQQCGKFHELAQFDGARHSCRSVLRGGLRAGAACC